MQQRTAWRPQAEAPSSCSKPLRQLPPRLDTRVDARKVEITRDFELVGQPFALVLATLGLPEDTLVKVRRRCSEGNQEDKPFALSGASLPAAYGGGRVDVPDQGDDKSSGLSWADRIGGGAAAVVASATAAAGAGSSRGVDGIIPFALRRRPPYHRLGTNAGGERPDKLSEAAVPCIEMATIKTSEITDVTAGKEAPTLSKSTRSNGREDSHPLGDVYNVAPKATVRAGDILVLSCDGDAMVRFQGSVGSRRRKGLKVLGISTLKLARHGTVFLKLVLSRSSEFLGRTARAENPFFSARYGCSVVAFRLKGGTGGGVDLIGSNPETPIRTSSDDLRCPTDLASETACLPTCGRDNNVATPTNFVDGVDEALIVSKNDPPKPVRSPLHSALPTPLLSSPGDGGSPTVGASPPREAALPPRRRRREGFEAGDVVMVLTNEGFLEQTSSKREFLSMERVGRLPEPIGWFHFGPLVIFAAMLAWVLVGDVGMVGGARKAPDRGAGRACACACARACVCRICFPSERLAAILFCARSAALLQHGYRCRIPHDLWYALDMCASLDLPKFFQRRS